MRPNNHKEKKMRLPKQTSHVERVMAPQAAAAGTVAPAGFLDVLKSVGANALKGALSGVAGGL